MAASRISKPLLVGQARDYADERNVSPLGQVTLGLQAQLVLDPSIKRVNVVRHSDLPARGRIPRIHVDTVQNPVQVVLPLTQQRIKTLAELRREDFPGIGRADGVDRVGEEDAARQEVNRLV